MWMELLQCIFSLVDLPSFAFPLNLRHITHLCTSCQTIALAFTMHIPLCLKWFKVIPLAPWARLWWLYWVITLETARFFARRTGWLSSSVKFDFLNLPPTRKMPIVWFHWQIIQLVPKGRFSLELSGSVRCQCYHLAGSKVKLCQYCLTTFLLLPWLALSFFSSLSSFRLSLVPLITQSCFECWKHWH